MSSSTLSCPGLLLALFAGMVMTGTAVAQQAGQGLEEITVVAPRAVTRTTVGRTNLGGKVELISLTRRVDYSDLDLKDRADVMELEKRIDDIAKESCGQLEQMYPNAAPRSPNCVKEAVASAKPQLDKAIAAAPKH